jgi:hypothetical protein
MASSPSRYWPLDDAPGSSVARERVSNSVGNIYGGVTLGVADPWGQSGAATFDGSTGEIVDSNSWTSANTGSPYSIEFFYRTTGTVGGVIEHNQTSAAGTISGSYSRDVVMSGSGGTTLNGYNYSTSGVHVVDVAATNDGNWHHCVLTHDGTSTMTLYRDGGQVAIIAVTGVYVAAFFWRIGHTFLTSAGSSGTLGYFTGSLAHIAIYTRALSAGEIASHYSSLLGVILPVPVRVGSVNGAAGTGPYVIPVPAGYPQGTTVFVHALTSNTVYPTSVADSLGNAFTMIASLLWNSPNGDTSVWVLDNAPALPAGGSISVVAPATAAVSAVAITVAGPLTRANGPTGMNTSVPSLATGAIANVPALMLAFEGNWTSALSWLVPSIALGGAVSGNSNGYMHTSYANVTNPAGVTVALNGAATTIWGMILHFMTPTPPTITSTLPPNGAVGVAYQAVLTATGGRPPYTWQASGLPLGLSVSGNTVTGAPTAGAVYSVTLTCTDSVGASSSSVQQITTIRITVPPIPPDEVWAEILDTNLVSHGLIQYASINAQLYYNAVGSWSILAQYTDDLWNLMMHTLNGQFIVSINWRGIFTFGGKCETPSYMDSIPGSTGMTAGGGLAGPFIALAGADYLGLIANKIAYPDPTKAWNAQLASSSWSVTNVHIESSIKALVNANIGPTSIPIGSPPSQSAGAIASRQMSLIDFAADQSRGPAINYVVKFNSGVGLNLLDIIRLIISQNYTNPLSSMGISLKRNGSRLLFDVYIPRDLSKTVWFSEDTGNLTSIQLSLTDPTCTDALVQGASAFVQAQSAGVTQWNKVEQFIDNSSETSTPNLTAAAQDALISGTYGPAMSTTVTDTPYLVFGQDYGLGDVVTVQVRNGDVYSDIVSGVTLTADPSQQPVINVVPTIGNSTSSTATDNKIIAQLVHRIKTVEKRLSTK